MFWFYGGGCGGLAFLGEGEHKAPQTTTRGECAHPHSCTQTWGRCCKKGKKSPELQSPLKKMSWLKIAENE